MGHAGGGADPRPAVDKDGRERTFETGEPCTLRLAYRAPRPIEDPVFGIGVFRKDGVRCYGTNTAGGARAGEDRGRGRGPRGHRAARPRGGEYFLDVAVHARDGHPHDYHSRLYALATRSRVRDTGVARLAHRWRLPDGGGVGA